MFIRDMIGCHDGAFRGFAAGIIDRNNGSPAVLINDGATVCCLDDVEILINQAVCFIRCRCQRNKPEQIVLGYDPVAAVTDRNINQ